MSESPLMRGRDLSRVPALPANPPGFGGSSEEDGPSVRGVLAAVRRHYWVVLAFAAVGLGLSAFAIARSEPLYASRAVIQLPEQRAQGGGGLAGLAASLGAGGGSINSQAQVIRSRLLLGQVVDSLGLRLHREVPGIPRSRYRPVGWLTEVSIAESLEQGTVEFAFGDSDVGVSFGGQSVRAAYGEPVAFDGLRFVVAENPGLEEAVLYIVSRKSAIDALIEETRAMPRDGTNLIDIVANGYDPAVTQRIADLTAQLYRQFTVATARRQAERQHQFVLEQLATTEELLRQTQDQLTDFRRRAGLYSSRAQAIMDQTGRTELEVRRAELVAARHLYGSLLGELREGEGDAPSPDVIRAIAVSPGVAGNPIIASAYETLTTYQQQRDSLLIGVAALSPNNPDVRGMDSLIARSQSNLLALTEGHVASIDAQIAALDLVGERVDSAFQHLASNEPEEVRLMLRLEAISEAASELRERSYTAGMAEAGLVDEVNVLDPALPGESTGTGPVRSLLLGLIFGVLVGSAGAIVLDSNNRSIRRREEVERVLRIPGLGVIPPIKAAGGGRSRLKLPANLWNGNGSAANGQNGRAPELVALNEVNSPEAEAYRTVRTNLDFGSLDALPRTLMVTSASNGEGKTTTAANLAVTFAQRGRKVLLIDSDLRRARLHAVFGVAREPGLAQLLLGQVSAKDAIRPTRVPRLSLLPGGSSTETSAADLLAGDHLGQLLEKLRDEFDLIILDSPPVLLTADSLILATQVDAALLVVRAGQTERETALYAVHQLAAVGAHVLGGVLNDPDSMLTGAGSYPARAYAPA